MLYNIILLESRFSIQNLFVLHAEVVNSQLCFDKSHFIIIAIVFIILSLTIIILLVCCCYFACKTLTGRKTRNDQNRRKTRNDQDGHITSILVEPRAIETDRQSSLGLLCPDSIKFDRLAEDLKQLSMRKIGESGWENDKPYKICLHQLLLLSCDIRTEKKLPTIVPQIQCEADAPQNEEFFPEMDDLPPQFRSITYYYYKDHGISWKGSADDENEEPDPRAVDNENEKIDIIAADTENKNNDQVEFSKM